MRNLLLVIFILFPTFSIAIDSYDSTTGLVHMPNVSVGSENYEVYMLHQGNLVFKVTSATLTSTTTSPDTYAPTTGIVHMPNVSVGSENYVVNMLHLGDLVFQVTSAAQIYGQQHVFDFKDYSPMTVGSYRRIIEYENGQQPDYHRYEIIGTVNIDGHEVYQEGYYHHETTLEEANLSSFDDNNFYHYGDQLFVADEDEVTGIYKLTPPVTIPRQVRVGDIFTGNSAITAPNEEIIDNVSWQFKIVEHIPIITLDNQQTYYDCLKFEFTDPEETSTEWRCKDIGWVKYSDQEITEEVLSYYIAN